MQQSLTLFDVLVVLQDLTYITSGDIKGEAPPCLQEVCCCGEGRDRIFTGDGDDYIEGGAGSDFIVLNGGLAIVVLAASGRSRDRDIIQGFRLGETRFALEEGLTFADLSFQQGVDFTNILAGTQLLATVLNVAVGDLNLATNFG